MRLESYPKILSIGDPLLDNLFNGEVRVEEKLDGSLLRMFFDAEGNMHFGSKQVDYSDMSPPDKMFVKGIAELEQLFAGSPYKNTSIFFEYISSPKHNTLKYDRTPKHFCVLLDVNQGGKWLDFEEKAAFAQLFDLEVPPILYLGKVEDLKHLNELLKMQSFLAGVQVEGVVVKNYTQMHSAPWMMGAPVFGKLVREEFKELNKENWGQGKSIEEKVLGAFPKEARWNKCIQHLRDKGQLQNGVRDIGNLIKEFEVDFEEECKEMVKEKLYQEFRHAIISHMRRGLPEYYKQQLAKEAFEHGAEAADK